MTYIKGIGMTKFDVDQRSSYERVYECVNDALDSGNIGIENIDVIFVSNAEAESNGERQKHIGPMMSSMFQKKMPIVTVPAGCGGGGTALWNAIHYQKNNKENNILVIGFEKLVANLSERATDEMLMGGERVYEQNEGVIFPAQNALVAQQYMMKYNATEDDLALVALKNHDNAFLNPKARFTDIEIAGSGLSTSNLASFEREDMTSWDSTVTAGKIAYKEAGIKPKDIDIAEVHDAFTPVELISYEDLGFTGKGKGKDLIREGYTNLSGKLPVNTSGGLKAKGHPISATGVSQIYELVLQLRGQAGKRQVDNVKICLAHNIGGAGSTASVHILKKVV
ncbi:hypothetical protein HYU50_02460 [Candidatus Woesearchaeota archaeon]|nr:hypothetical protein [Candidatus Woesearchaeota archaeon]